MVLRYNEATNNGEVKKMYEMQRSMQTIIEEIDGCIRRHEEEALTLARVAERAGYSESHFSRKFRAVSGMQFRDYLRGRRLALALKELRDSEKNILEIALDFGFSSNEAFTRAFRDLYGLTPSEYRRHLAPVALRTVIHPFDCCLLGVGGTGMAEAAGDVKAYFVQIPAHKFLHIRNYESVGYWDFWQKQSTIPERDCDTICGLLESIPNKLDDTGEGENPAAGQVMGFINAPEGRICSWGIPLAEAYGVRLPADWQGEIPKQMRLMDVEAGEYIVFEHGPFDFERQHASVEQKIEAAMREFDYAAAGCCLDTRAEKVFYFCFDPEMYWKYIRPVKRL